MRTRSLLLELLKAANPFGCQPYENPVGEGVPEDRSGQVRGEGETDSAGNEQAPPGAEEIVPYTPPSSAFLPQSNARGIFYHPRLEKEGGILRSSFPVGLQCRETEEKCYFGVGRKVYSFNTEELTGEPSTMLQTEADFAPEIDGQSSWFTGMLYYNDHFYGQFDRFEGGLEQGTPQAGIALRSNMGEYGPTFYYPAVDFGEEGVQAVSCPKSLLPYSDLAEEKEEIWTVTSNCVGNNNFREGTIFPLTVGENGELTLATDQPLRTTQQNPQKMVGWNANNKTYILVVNTGLTTHTETGPSKKEDAPGFSGVDVIDPDKKRVIANVSLGQASAQSITVSGDGKIAFIGSQVRPQMYVLDLEMLADNLSELPNDPTAQPAIIRGVTIADAYNAIPLDWSETNYFPALLYDDATRTVLVASFNDGFLVQIGGDYVVKSGLGVHHAGNFGRVLNNFACTGPETENCTELAQIRGGIVALTGHPTSITFVPNSRLGR